MNDTILLPPNSLIEVKNERYQGYTRQIKDFISIQKQITWISHYIQEGTQLYLDL